MMKEVSTVLKKYRECSRNLWNTYFLGVSEISIADLRERFEEIDKLLFNVLVLTQLGRAESEWPASGEPFSFLKIIPTPGARVPIMINRPSDDGNKYWDDPVDKVEASEVDLRFVEYFDWNQYDYIDCRYFLTRIESFEKHPHLVGRYALIETLYARVFLVGETG